MAAGEPSLLERALRGWIAFCVGWWSVGFLLAVREYVQWEDRAAASLREQLGVPLVAGSFRPGVEPVILAESLVLGRAGGTTIAAVGVGFFVLFLVWPGLPLALTYEAYITDRLVERIRLAAGAAFPYVGAYTGGLALYRYRRRQGESPRRALVVVLATALGTYLALAATLFGVTVLVLSIGR